MAASPIQVLRHGPIAELNLNRPPVNALDEGLLEALTVSIAAAVEDGAEAAVLSGRPGLFCAGIDVRALLAADRAGVASYWERFFGALRTIARSPIPIGAAITGHCPAGGAVLALFCDRRIMADGDFTIGLNEARVGLPLPALILAALRRQVGARRAEHLAVGGRLLRPQAALAAGLVDAVVPPADVLPAAIAWARELTELPPVAMRATRIDARADLAALFDDIDARDTTLTVERWLSDETQRTMRAMLEARSRTSADAPGS
ncbi:enoyl-CoA hydratase/isomerase family protein [soil metagenome]